MPASELQLVKSGNTGLYINVVMGFKLFKRVFYSRSNFKTIQFYRSIVEAPAC